MGSVGEVTYCQLCIENNVRLDGRQCLDMRPVELELGVIAQAAGSARLHMGATDVVVGVKVEVGSPSSSAPDQGQLQVTVEFSPCASPMFQGMKGETYGQQLASALESSLIAGLDLGRLGIIKGKACWQLYVDALVLNDDGNVLPAASLAALAALHNTRVPKVEAVADDGDQEIELDDSPGSAWRLDVSRVPLLLTLSQVGSRCVADLTAAEELCAASAAHIAVGASGQVCGATLSGRRGVDPGMMMLMVESAQACGPKLWAGALEFLRASDP